MIVTLKTLQRLHELDVGPQILADIDESSMYSLALDRPYVVYAVDIRNNMPRYFIAADDRSSYPMWYHAPAFDVVDDRVSRYWTFHTRRLGDDPAPEGYELSIGFPEWHERYYYDRLTDGEPEAIRAYRYYKQRMDLEFALPGVTDEAEPLDETWVMCPECTESWQVEFEGEMVQCPACHRYWRRPDV